MTKEIKINKIDKKNAIKTKDTIKKWFWSKKKDLVDYCKDPVYDTNVRQKCWYYAVAYAYIYNSYEQEYDPKVEDILKYMASYYRAMEKCFELNNMKELNNILNEKFIKKCIKVGMDLTKQIPELRFMY